MELDQLSVVIVTFRSEDKINSCLGSIPTNIPVILVENSNNVDFKKKIENQYPNVECILTGENNGYAVANNIGLSKVKTKYALVLNPDAIIKKNTIENFLKITDQYNDFWLIGPVNNQANKDIIDRPETFEVNDLKGFAIFFNLVKFKGSYFDENFFLYFAEIDLCRKVKKNKGKIFLSKKIMIDHEGSGSVRKDNKLEFEKNRNWHWMWSSFYFHKKYKGFFVALIIMLPNLFTSLFKTFFYQIIFNTQKRDIYFCRLSGIINSIIGKKSWYRPSID